MVAQDQVDTSMKPPENRTAYTVTQAAQRVQRSQRTIERWIEAGMRCTTMNGRIYIGHDDLLSFFRKMLRSNPARTHPNE